VTAATLPLDIEGPAAPPRANGELVFAEPWEGRAFGLTMALADRGVLSYDAFREVLITRIAAWEADHPVGGVLQLLRLLAAGLGAGARE